MKPNKLVLLVGESRPELDAALERLSHTCPVRVVRMERPAIACARIGGGGVDAVLLQATAIDSIAMLRQAAPEVPIVAFCDAHDKLAGESAIRAGAAAYLPIANSIQDICSLVAAELHEDQPSGPRHRASSRTGRAAILAIIGSKGGVGTTTLAQNAAAILARDHRVVLVELRSQFGTLRHHFLPRLPRRSLADLMTGPAGLEIAQVESCLWQYPRLPALTVLFGPPGIIQPGLSPAQVLPLLDAIAQLADYVVLDMPPSCSGANRTAIQQADLLALVLERDPICLPCAKALLEAFGNVTPALAGLVVVNRVGLATPFDLSQAEAQFDIPIFGVIPPAPELCIASRQAFTPLVLFDPESMVAGCMDQFVSHLRIRAGAAF